ncbi:MAG: HyaD/HybD family hydrogenase maturation endopeptidase [Candidatus Marinimicrobia bacterium]|nr:HyaD/HybD family hydrogenase maturation endopeptidase [Candidatus Neomarinimicrobiota bacterium]MBL6985287.1 HyaD/HybD family hydrogenase maturation endopeptidase [Candidatus Thioglobus sp.]
MLLEKSPDILVMGLGNILLQDEGVGVHIVRKLEKKFHFNPLIEIVDGGTIGIELLSNIEGKKKVLFVDAVNFGKKPGHIQKLIGEEIMTVMLTKLSEHQTGLTEILSTAKLMDIKNEELILLGVQPSSIDMGLDLSNDLETACEKVIDVILDILDSWGVSYWSHHQNKSIQF